MNIQTLKDSTINGDYEADLKLLTASEIVLKLGAEDSCAFVKSILQPRYPTELPVLQAAIKQYQQSFGQS